MKIFEKFIPIFIYLLVASSLVNGQIETYLDPGRISLGLPQAQNSDTEFNLSLNEPRLCGMQLINANAAASEVVLVGQGSNRRYMYMSYINPEGALAGSAFKRGAGILFTGGPNGMNLISTADDIRFVVGGIQESYERMVIKYDGNVGIGTQIPNSKLQVSSGDVYIEDINSGVIMKSADGSCWRMTIENGGAVKTDSIPCP